MFQIDLMAAIIYVVMHFEQKQKWQTENIGFARWIEKGAKKNSVLHIVKKPKWEKKRIKKCALKNVRYSVMSEIVLVSLKAEIIFTQVEDTPLIIFGFSTFSSIPVITPMPKTSESCTVS